jgi:pilus assembly protein CpaC
MTCPSLQFRVALLALTAAFPGTGLAQAAPERGTSIKRTNTATPPPRPRSRALRVGESQVLQFRWVTKVAVGNPAVADVVVVSDDEVLLNGKAPGETNLFVWDRGGRWEYQVAVAGADRPVARDIAQVAAAVRQDLAGMPVEVRVVHDTLFLTGEVGSAEEKARAETIAAVHQAPVRSFLRVAAAPPPARRGTAEVAAALNRVFAGGAVSARALDEGSVVLEGNVAGDAAEQARRVARTLAPDVTVVDYFSTAGPRRRQVLVRTQVLEVDKRRVRELGIDWGSLTTDENGSFGVSQPFLFGQRAGGGGLLRPFRIGAAVRALEQQNAGRVLSEPNLLVMEGTKGSVLIGGEIPIPVPQASGGGTVVTVEYRSFGIKLDVDVLGIGEDGINLTVRPEVSMPDSTNSVRLSGFNIPGLQTNRAETTVRVRTGESLAIGGLVQRSEIKQKSAVPILSRIPILGELFKSRRFEKGETELVILVTPEVKENTP